MRAPHSRGGCRGCVHGIGRGQCRVRPAHAAELAFLVSADGKIIAHKDQGLTLKPITELSKDLAIEPLLAAATNKGLLPTDIAGRSRLLSVVPITGTSWMLVVALDESEAMAPIRAMLATSLISSVLVLVVAVALLGVVLRPPASRSTAVRWSAMWRPRWTRSTRPRARSTTSSA